MAFSRAKFLEKESAKKKFGLFCSRNICFIAKHILISILKDDICFQYNRQFLANCMTLYNSHINGVLSIFQEREIFDNVARN